MGRLIHTGLGSSSLIAHVLHSPPPPREQLCNRSCSKKTHTFLRLSSFSTGHWETEAHFTVTGGRLNVIAGKPTVDSELEQLGSTPVQARGILQRPEEQSRTCGCQSGSVERINLNFQGCGIVATPMHAPSRTPLLLPLLLSHNLPTPRVH